MLLNPRSLLILLAAIFLFFALSLSEKHIRRIFDYKAIPIAEQKKLARSWRLTALGLSFLLAGAGTGRAVLLVAGVILIFISRTLKGGA